MEVRRPRARHAGVPRQLVARRCVRPRRDATPRADPRAVIRAVSSGKVLTTFSEVRCPAPGESGVRTLTRVRGQMSEVQADKRGTFIVVASVESTGVTSWSLNVSVVHSHISDPRLLTPIPPQAVNNSDALKLLASIELACYRCKQAILEPGRYNKSRRRIEKVVREDRRRRHTNKREEDELATAFGQQTIAGGDEPPDLSSESPVDMPM